MWPFKIYSKRHPKQAEEPVAYTPLARLDLGSSTWAYVLEFTTKRMSELREKNDKKSLNDIETAIIRGKISFAKEVLELGKQKKERHDEPGAGREGLF